MASEYTVARPYAKAAFEFAVIKNQLAQWSEMLEAAKWIIQNEAVENMLKDPCVSTDQVMAFIYSIDNKLFGPDFKNFLHVLSDNKRLSFIPYIFDHFEKLRAEAEQVVNVEITSAFELSDKYKEQFIQVLKKRMQCEIALSVKTDASILAGAIVRAGDLLIDGSLRGKLSRLNDAMGIFH